MTSFECEDARVRQWGVARAVVVVRLWKDWPGGSTFVSRVHRVSCFWCVRPGFVFKQCWLRTQGRCEICTGTWVFHVLRRKYLVREFARQYVCVHVYVCVVCVCVVCCV
jgi:hypothetical protein